MHLECLRRQLSHLDRETGGARSASLLKSDATSERGVKRATDAAFDMVRVNPSNRRLTCPRTARGGGATIGIEEIDAEA
ncbi:MAG: hypothetical protein ABSG56_07280 [Bryobacteraceae bacterium]